MTLAAQLKKIKALPDSDSKYDKLIMLALKAMPRGSVQNDANRELERLRKAGYNSPIVKRANTTGGQGKYQTVMVGSDGKKLPPVTWKSKAEAESAKRDAELLGYETELREVTSNKSSKGGDKKMVNAERKIIHLQGIGRHPAVKASELKPGDITVWNGGDTEKIIAVTPSKSGKTIKATIEYKNFDGKTVRTTRKLSSDRLVGIDNSVKKKPETKIQKSVTPKAKPVKDKPASVPKKPKATTYTVMGKTFATKAEARAYKALQKQKAGKPCEIKESTRKPSHKVVSFTAKSK